jgi:hypothetical protein
MLKVGGTIFVHGGISPEFLAMGLSADTANKKLHLTPPEERDELNAFLQGPGGPLWYRGMVLGDREDSISSQDLKRILIHLKAKRIVVGHTTMDRVSSLHGGRVLAADVGVQHGRAEGLFMAKGKAYRALADGSKAPVD